MDLKEIKAVIDLMTRNGLSEFELEKGDFKIRVKRGPSGEWITTAASAPAPSAAPAVVPHQAPVSAIPAVTSMGVHTPAPPAAGNMIIPSPMVGTAYLAPSPDLPPFLTVGQEVQEDTVVCIIEAMKVMNEIKAETKGVVVEILAQNGKPVEFGKPLFTIRPT